MASNSCKLCELSGRFEASDTHLEPIEEIVRAVGVKFLPWEGGPQSLSVDHFNLAALWSYMDVDWQQEVVVNFKRDEQAKPHDRANRAEDDISEFVR